MEGNFVMCVGGFPSFLLLNEYAANITAKGKGRLGAWREGEMGVVLFLRILVHPNIYKT